MKRPTRDELFIEVAGLFAKRSTCKRANVGAVIVRGNRIVATGYNGAPSTMLHCIESDCELGSDGGCQRAVHAEANAIAFAARDGIRLNGATMYTTHSPCYKCAQLIINAGIAHVVYSKAYRDSSGLQLLDEAGIEFNEYEDQG